MDYDYENAVTWVYLVDAATGESHMLEFDGEYDRVSHDEVADLVVRDYSDRWPTKDAFRINQVELGAPDQ